jgi:uncharacterized membrane protein YkvA (DUF1232 family)
VGPFLDATAEDQRVDAKSEVLLRLAKQYNSSFWASEEHTRQIVRFQYRAGQVWEYLELSTKTLAMVYNAMLPRNPQPKTLPELMNKFKSLDQIHGFVKAHLLAGARFSTIMLQICHQKLDMSNTLERCHAKLKRRRRNVNKITNEVTPIAEKMIADLLRMNVEYFTDNHYADSMGAPPKNERIHIEYLIGNE